jgi:Carboxypeptidase regulatory-like domain
MNSMKGISSVLIFAMTMGASAQPPEAKRVDGAAQLPVTRVALYKNGVGFFEHSGRVTGDESVTIDFTTSQLNDVLQSLTAIDLNGGRIAGAGYNSSTPLDEQLRALPLALGQNPSPMEFYNSIRGARVEVTGPGGVKVTGRLFNIEVKRLPPGKDGQPGEERRVITVIGEEGGVRTAELTPTTEVRLLDAGLHQDLTRYLELLANNRNQGLRHLTLQDNGSGARELRVSYISEVPIWKSTYRILFTEPEAGSKANQTATLQGWSVVDNTTGADWVNVKLSLIAGAPQSFIQPLSVPYYSRRVQIGMQQEAQMAPVLHQSGEMRSGTGAIAGVVRDPSGAVIANAKVTATNTQTGVAVSRQSSRTGEYSISGLPAGNYNVEIVANGFQRQLQENVRIGGMQTASVNPRLKVGGSTQTVTVTDAPPSLDTMNATLGGTIENELYAQQPLSMGGLAQGVYGGTGRSNLNMNYVEGIPVSSVAPMNYEQVASDSLNASGSTATFDDYFEYKIGEPITIRKNESAMVPILQAKIDAERVTLWGPQHPTPLRALWVTNTSKLTLDRGSFSIVEDGNFGGEGLLDAIHPAEKRLLSYAVDQAVRVSTEGQGNSQWVTSISAAKGVLVIHNSQLAEVTYVVRNAAAEPRAVVIEHPIRQGYALDGSKTDAKPEETTPALYRYKVQAEAGETVRLHVGEHQDGAVEYKLALSNDNELEVILNAVHHNEATEKALAPILEARRHVAEMQEGVDTAGVQLNSLRQDEERQRENISALAAADKSSRERFVRDLNATEDQMAVVQKEITAAEARVQAAKDDLANKIEALQIEETL